MNGTKSERPDKCYGSTTMSERGQVVIPVQARREIGLEPGTKLLVFGSRGKSGLILVTADTVTEFIRNAISSLSQFEQMMKEKT